MILNLLVSYLLVSVVVLPLLELLLDWRDRGRQDRADLRRLRSR